MQVMLLRLMIFALLFSLPTASHAEEPLVYRDHPKDAREESVLDYLKLIKRYDPALPLGMAAVDLNGDGVDEWIIRQVTSASCETAANCPYVVAGLSDKEPALLGEFPARKVGIADEKLYGVRKLLVYNEKNNDFAFKTYVWTPAETAFRPK